MILNLGCGSNKIPGAINVDINSAWSPDVLADMKNGLPFKDVMFDEVYLFHTIEHIPKGQHGSILTEIRRVLKDDAYVYIAYPEFIKVATNYITNFAGKRNFWEATIYGRQSSPSDFHVALMNSVEFREILEQVGFYQIQFKPEINSDFNTIMRARKGDPMPSYEEVLYNDVFGKASELN